MDELTNKKPAGPKATAWDVIHSIWKATKPFKGYFTLDVLGIVISNIVAIFTPLLYKDFFNLLTSTDDKTIIAPQLGNIILMILGLNTVIWIFYRANTFSHNAYQTKAMAKIRQDAFDYMMGHSHGFFANSFTGSLVQRVNRLARAFERLTDRFIWSMLPLFIQIVGVCIVLWFINPIITYVVLVWVCSFMIFNFYFSRWRLKYNLQMAEADSLSTGYLSDAISNYNNVQLFTAHEYETKGFKKVTNDQAKISNFAWNLGAIVDAVQAGLVFFIEFLLFYIGIKYWQSGAIDIGVFVLIQVYFIGLGAKLWDFSRIIRDIYEGFADAKEMIDILKTPHEIRDVPGAKRLVVSKGDIAFKDLVFSFNQTRIVLNKINLSIPAGQKVALIGPSGAGKSTFVRLVLRMYDPTSGHITIDNEDIESVTQDSLRKNIGFVPQEPILFHRSLKENIKYGKRNATDEEVIQAAKLAHCDEFIKDLPLGYDTLVGERGIKLSGGERQRIAIARAILKNAPILILDEATSSLDSESEHLIQDALDVLMKGKTVMVIAHRLSTIRKMDRIVVIDNGQIKEQGTHDELLENPLSLYSKLWNLQAGGFLKEEETES